MAFNKRMDLNLMRMLNTKNKILPILNAKSALILKPSN